MERGVGVRIEGGMERGSKELDCFFIKGLITFVEGQWKCYLKKTFLIKVNKTKSFHSCHGTLDPGVP